MKLLSVIVFIFVFSSLSYAKNKQWTCINTSGETLFNYEALNVGPFKNGRSKVYKNEYVNSEWTRYYGFIDNKANTIIAFELEAANDFIVPVTWVKFRGSRFYTLVNKDGKKIATKQYEKVGQFSGKDAHICPVYNNGAMGFINRLGQEVIPCQYIGGSIFQYNLLSVAKALGKNNLYGFINQRGEEVIPLKYKQSGPSGFEDGLARAKVNGSTVLIDTSGKIVFKTTKGNIQGYRNGLVLVFTNRTERTGYGWLNMDNQFVIDPIYDHAENFNEDGLAVVTHNGKKGLLDINGKMVLACKYQDLYANFSKDGFVMGTYPSDHPLPLSRAKKDYFDQNLQLQGLPQVMYLSPKKSGHLIPFKDKNKLMGFLAPNFEIEIEPIFKKVRAFSENLAWVIQQ